MNPLNEHIHPTSNSLSNFFESITKEEEDYFSHHDFSAIHDCIILIRMIESYRCAKSLGA